MNINTKASLVATAAVLGVVLFIATCLFTVSSLYGCQQSKPDIVVNVNQQQAVIKQIAEMPGPGIYELTYLDHKLIITRTSGGVSITPLCAHENSKVYHGSW